MRGSDFLANKELSGRKFRRELQQRRRFCQFHTTELHLIFMIVLDKVLKARSFTHSQMYLIFEMFQTDKGPGHKSSTATTWCLCWYWAEQLPGNVHLVDDSDGTCHRFYEILSFKDMPKRREGRREKVLIDKSFRSWSCSCITFS